MWVFIVKKIRESWYTILWASWQFYSDRVWKSDREEVQKTEQNPKKTQKLPLEETIKRGKGNRVSLLGASIEMLSVPGSELKNMKLKKCGNKQERKAKELSRENDTQSGKQKREMDSVGRRMRLKLRWGGLDSQKNKQRSKKQRKGLKNEALLRGGWSGQITTTEIAYQHNYTSFIIREKGEKKEKRTEGDANRVNKKGSTPCSFTQCTHEADAEVFY